MENNFFLSLVIDRLKELKAAKKGNTVSVAVSELRSYEPLPSQVSVLDFLSFVSGGYIPPEERLKNWCKMSNFSCQIERDNLYIKYAGR